MEPVVQRSKQGMVERISKIIEVKKLSASRFADILGVPRSTISHILSGRNNPSLEFIQKVLSSFPEVRVAWLLRGEEPMFISTNTLFSGVEYDDPPPGRTAKDNRPGSGSGSQSDNGEDGVKPGEATEKNDTEPVQTKANVAAQETVKEAAPVMNPSKASDTAPAPDAGHRLSGSLPGGSSGLDAGGTGKKAVRVVFFYTDGTFQEYLPGGY
jgi:transcriptional regulator with XRE-family HTH domain